jgi:hypothetical protein
MNEITLSLRKHSIANIALGISVILLSVWLGDTLKESFSTWLILVISVSLYGVSFIFIGLKYFYFVSPTIKYGGGRVELPLTASSEKMVSLNTSEIVEYGIKTFILPYIKVLYVHSEHSSVSISVNAFANKQDLRNLLEFLAREKC